MSHTPFAHAAQAAPPAPHSAADCDAYGTQVPPLQHPFGHDVASQTQLPAALHSWPAAHGEQLAPALPHDDAVSAANGWHTPADVQHPSGHDVASQTQLPAVLHSWPVAQAVQAVPAAPHDVADSAENGSHVSLAVQHPAQAAPPQVHAPPEHEPPFAHAPHAAPPVPHSDDDCPAGSTH